MKRTVLTIATILLITTALVQAQGEGEDEKKIGITLDFAYHTKWLSKGVEGYGQKGAFFSTIDLDFYGTGFGLKVTHRNATSSGYVDSQRFDYRPYYKGVFLPDETLATTYNISVGYEHYYGLNKRAANTTYEWILGLAWPNLLPEGFTPRYIVHYEYPAFSGQANRKVAGWVHRFRLDYEIAELANLPNPVLLTTEIAYNDGLANRCHDWSYTTTGVSTKFNLTENITFVPGIYHQTTLDKSISKRKDITYGIFSMKYKF